MKDALKNIDQAYGFLSQMVVNGDNVDLLAGARQALRVAYTQLEVAIKKADEKDDENDENDEEVTADGNSDRHPAEDAE